MKPTVFYFDFYNEDTETSIVKGFIIDAEVGGGDFNSWCEDSDFADHIEEVESDYGVHDWSTSESDSVNGIGYTTYEIDENKIDEVMAKHRQFFVDLVGDENVSPVVVVGNDISNEGDYEIYLDIKERAKII